MADKEQVYRMELKTSTIPRRFNVANPSILCVRDVVAYVRGIVKDPWLPVVLVTNETPFSVQDLEECRIYWEGVNDSKATEFQSIGVDSYFVVQASELDITKDDCGLEEMESNYQKEYDLKNFSILVTGDSTGPDAEALMKLRDYALSMERIDIIFPRFIIIQSKLLPGGLNISPYAARIDAKRQRNELSFVVLDEVLKELESLITPGVTAVQDLEEVRTLDVGMLTTYLTLKYNLPPVYVPSFIAEYMRYEFIYPFKRLSLYERITFLYRMPSVVGYLGINYGFNGLARVQKKIYPLPHYVLNISTMTLEDDVSQFALDTPGIRFADFRGSFSGSKQTRANPSEKALVVADKSDEDADRALCQLFSQMIGLVKQKTEEQIFPSVKNCMYAKLGNTTYLLYCPEECGVLVTFFSEYFGTLDHVIPEQEFYRLLDAQIEAALLQKSRAPTVAEGNKAMAVKWQALDTRVALHPAIPLETSLYMRVLPAHRNGLSYFDRMLRCCKDVLPIITSTDSKLRNISPIFDDISLEALWADPQAKQVLTCFGTVSKTVKQVPTLPVTYKAFTKGDLL